MSQYLVISAIGSDKSGLVNDLTKHIFNHECNILDSRMTILGGEFAILLMISGSEVNVSKLEKYLQTEPLSELTISTKRTTLKPKTEQMTACRVKIISIDNPGIVYKVAGFFSDQNINIKELKTHQYAAPHTGTPMFSVNLQIQISNQFPLSDLRESLTDFCDSLGIDSNIEKI